MSKFVEFIKKYNIVLGLNIIIVTPIILIAFLFGMVYHDAKNVCPTMNCDCGTIELKPQVKDAEGNIVDMVTIPYSRPYLSPHEEAIWWNETVEERK
jgi:hypothetical protein